LIDISRQRNLRGLVPVEDRPFVEIQILDNDLSAFDVTIVNGFRPSIGFVDEGVNKRPRVTPPLPSGSIA
jgi:hypothetical protein